MNKTFLIVVLFLCVGAVHAETVYREFNASTPAAKIYWQNFPYWLEVNQTGTLLVTNFNTAATNYAQIKIGSGNYSNMTYLASSYTFRAFVLGTSEEDDVVTVQVYDNLGNLLATGTDTLRFRVPFTVTLDFYKNSNVSSTNVEKYDNEFQYALLRYRADGKAPYSYTLDGRSANKFFNSVFSLLPYYRKVETSNVIVSQDVYVFARLNDGSAEIKMYQNGTYDLWTMNTDVVSALASLYEFGRPLRDGETQFRTSVADAFIVSNESDTGFDVFISAWQVYKWHLIKNVAKIIGVLVAWAFLVLGLAYVCTMWMPDPETRGKAFGIVLGVFATVTLPILVVAFGVLI